MEIGMIRDEKLTAVECHQRLPPSMDDPEQSVCLSFMSARCRWTSSAMAAAINDRSPVHQQTSKS
jgi:hypothetical protein